MARRKKPAPKPYQTLSCTEYLELKKSGQVEELNYRAVKTWYEQQHEEGAKRHHVWGEVEHSADGVDFLYQIGQCNDGRYFFARSLNCDLCDLWISADLLTMLKVSYLESYFPVESYDMNLDYLEGIEI